MGLDSVVPITMEDMRSQSNLPHLSVLDLLPRLVFPCIQNRLDGQSTLGRGSSDEVHDGLETDERPPLPVHADEGEEPMLDLVPLARSRRVVTDRNRHPHLIRELLEMKFPCSKATSVASTGIRADQNAPRRRIGLPSQHPPPTADALHCKVRRLVCDSNVHQSFVTGNIIRAVRDRLALSHVWEIMDEDFIRLSHPPPAPAPVVKGSNEFLLLRIDADDGVATSHERPDLLVDVPKLPVPIRVLGPLQRLDIPLQRVVHLPKTSRHRNVRNLKALALQFVSHRSCRLVRPLQITHRIARRRLVNNPSQRSLHGWIGFLDALPATT